SPVRYAARDGFRLIGRHWGMSILTVFTAMSVFFVIGASTLFVLNIKNIVRMMENQLAVTAYLKPDVNVTDVAKRIKEIQGVTEAKVVTKEMALERLRARIGSQAKAVTLLGDNPLPISIEIKVKSVSQVADAARLLLVLPEVDDVVYAGHLAEKLTRVSGFVEKFSFIMLLVAIAASAVVLFNTIRISVYSRESEIAVMLKVGATSTYIMMPFVIQGFILGFAGAVLASLLLGGTYYSAVERLKDMLPFLPFISSPRLIGKLAFVLVSCGTAVSLLSSLFAVEGFIRKAARPL
ncbi:MAG: permease-like cell division protein FtsX, partial [Synergistaceae bacterium]|nr:permease-like cell division protein FtsX [Synergistaceae bacterium]